MKTKITAKRNTVTIERNDPVSGERIRTVYYTANGIVRLCDMDGNYPQVCDGLRSTGNTLRATPETLLAVIRRELRR